VPWTPARALGTLVFVGVTAGGALVLSNGRVDAPPPSAVAAGDATTTTGAGDAPSASTTTKPTTTTSPTTTTTAEPPLPGPVRLLPSSRFDLRGVGPVEAGMTVHEAEQATGVRLTLAPIAATSGRCSSATAADVPGLTFVVAAPGGAAESDAKAGTIARATATDPSFATVSNARVGMALAEARAIYAGRYEEVRFGRGGVALTIRGRSGADRDMAVRIESTDGQRVTSLASGLANALAAPDGCA
jgi:hypothetical protein